MNRTTGSTIFNTLYWLFPVLLTGLVFFDESKTAIYGIIITKKKRCVYLCSKALSVFFVSFVSTLFLFLFNLFLVYVTCPSSMELSETMIPHTGTFSALLFQKSPLYEAVTYVILHAFSLSLLTVLYLAIQMIVKAKNKYMAFILPPIIMYVLDYLTQTAAQTYSVTMALQPMVARATSFVITIEDIAIIFGALLAIDNGEILPWDGEKTFIGVLIKQDDQYVGYAAIMIERPENNWRYNATIINCKEIAPEERSNSEIMSEDLYKMIDSAVESAK